MKFTMLLTCFALAGCARQPHSVAWYTSHPAAAKAMWARCHADQDPSRPDCQRAGEVTANIAAQHDEQGIDHVPPPRTGPSSADYAHWGDTQKGRQS